MIYYNCDYMKNKNSWKEASEYIKEARKDPEFRKDLKEFIKQAQKGDEEINKGKYKTLKRRAMNR